MILHNDYDDNDDERHLYSHLHLIIRDKNFELNVMENY